MQVPSTLRKYNESDERQVEEIYNQNFIDLAGFINILAGLLWIFNKTGRRFIFCGLSNTNCRRTIYRGMEFVFFVSRQIDYGIILT